MDVQNTIERFREENPESIQSPVLGSEGSSKRQKTGFQGPIRVNKILMDYCKNMFHKYVYSPPQAVRNCIEWVRSDKVQNIFETHPEFTGALDNWETELYNFSYSDFKGFYQIEREYRWRPGAVYHSVEDSVKYAEKWLHTFSQLGTICNGTNEPHTRYDLTPKGILQAFSDVLNRRISKLNCIHLVGRRNAGKTWFTNMFLDFYVSRGDLENWNKYVNASFPFMNLPNRRVALWNEACITGDLCQLEFLKILMEGASTTVAVKHKKPAVLCRVPLIVTSNAHFYNSHDFFESRRVLLNCPGEPFEGWEKSLHPWAWMELVHKYNIATDEELTWKENPSSNVSKYVPPTQNVIVESCIE